MLEPGISQAKFIVDYDTGSRTSPEQEMIRQQWESLFVACDNSDVWELFT